VIALSHSFAHPRQRAPHSLTSHRSTTHDIESLRTSTSKIHPLNPQPRPLEISPNLPRLSLYLTCYRRGFKRPRLKEKKSQRAGNENKTEGSERRVGEQRVNREERKRKEERQKGLTCHTKGAPLHSFPSVPSISLLISRKSSSISSGRETFSARPVVEVRWYTHLPPPPPLLPPEDV